MGPGILEHQRREGPADEAGTRQVAIANPPRQPAQLPPTERRHEPLPTCISASPSGRRPRLAHRQGTWPTDTERSLADHHTLGAEQARPAADKKGRRVPGSCCQTQMWRSPEGRCRNPHQSLHGSYSPCPRKLCHPFNAGLDATKQKRHGIGCLAVLGRENGNRFALMSDSLHQGVR